MRQGFIGLTTVSLLMLAGCAGTKYLGLITAAETAFTRQDYTLALGASEQVITGLSRKNKPAEGRVYAIAGNSAYALEQYDKSLVYLEKAQQQGYADELMYMNLSGLYQRMDNLSKEINALRAYTKLYPEGDNINPVRCRLYQTCSESTDYALAEQLWPLLEEASRNDITLLEVFLSINQAQDKESRCDSAAYVILKKNPDHEAALKWFAEKYYRQAEDRYQAELEAYNKNKTHRQYAILVEAFKIVTGDFKESLKYFTKLYKLYPNADYARYLGNIYARLDDEEAARYYHNKAK